MTRAWNLNCEADDNFMTAFFIAVLPLIVGYQSPEHSICAKRPTPHCDGREKVFPRDQAVAVVAESGQQVQR